MPVTIHDQRKGKIPNGWWESCLFLWESDCIQLVVGPINDGSIPLSIDLSETCLVSHGIIVSQMEKQPSAELYWTTHLANSSYCSTHLRKGSFYSWSLDRIRSWAQVGACGRLFLFSPSRSAKGGEEQMANLCPEAQAEILPQGQKFIIRLFKYILDFSYVL